MPNGDDKKRRGLPVRERRIQPPEELMVMERNARLQAGQRHAMRLMQEGQALAMPSDATRADLRALIPADDREGTPLTDMGMGRAPVDMWDSRGQDSSLLLPLWYAAHAWTQNQGGTVEEARAMYDMFEYMVEPPRTAEQWAEYREWATDPTASWSDMPKGVLGVELPADLLGTAPGIFLGFRDIVKDVSNGEQSWWNIFDAMGMLPLVGIAGTLRRGAGGFSAAAQNARRLSRAAHLSNDVQLTRVARQAWNDTPGGREAIYYFKTPQGNVEVSVAEPGKHNQTGYRDDPSVQITGPKSEEIAHAEDTIWTAIKREDAQYGRGFEGTIGDAEIAEIWRQVAMFYPDAKWIGGRRVTGSRNAPDARDAERFGNADGVDVWVHIDRDKLKNSPSWRRLEHLRQNDPEGYEELVALMKDNGVDVSPEAIRTQEAEALTKGLPYQLWPTQLAEHEAAIRDIFRRNGDWDEAYAEAIDYLDDKEIKASGYYDTDASNLGQLIINGAIGDSDSAVDILNPMKIGATEGDEALAALEEAGINPRSGRISAQASYRRQLENTWTPRLMDELRRRGYEVGDHRVEHNGVGPSIINIFDDEGNMLLHMQVLQDQRYGAGMRVEELASDFGAHVTQEIADRLPRLDVGISESVADMRSPITYGPARRTAADVAQPMAPEAQAIAEVPLETGTPRRRPRPALDDEATIAEARALVADTDGDAYASAFQLVSESNVAPADAMLLVDDAMDQLGYGARQRWPDEEIRGLERYADRSNTPARASRPPRRTSAWYQRLDEDVPDDRYISVFRRHRNADAPLDPTNPDMRTGQEGSERTRRANNPSIYHPRTPMYIRGQAPEARFENMPIQIEARIPESRVYDINADPKGYVQKLRDGELRDFTEVEDLIFRDGDYAALADYEKGQAWFFMEPEETHRVNLQTGQALDSSGQGYSADWTPLEARGIPRYSEMGDDPTRFQPLGVTEAQQRSHIRQGTAPEYEMQAWPELAGAEAGQRGDMLFDEARRLWNDESGEVVKGLPGAEPPEPPRLPGGAGGEGAARHGEVLDAGVEVTAWDREMAALLNSGEGTTQTVSGRKPPKRERYIVSPNKSTETTFDLGSVTPEDVAAFRQAHGVALDNGYFGAWVDDGRVYMDVSRGFSSKKAAMDVAQAGDQMSIADMKAIKAEDWDNAFISNELYDPELGGTRWPNERQRAETRARTYIHMPDLAEAADERMLRNMGPQTREWYEGSRPHVQRRVREMYRLMLSDEELATMMALGEQTKGWYEGAAGTIRNAYGEDAEQFMALLAATSPNVPVESNVRFAQDLWAEWNQAGRPKDPEMIQFMFDDVAQGTGIFQLEGHQVVPNANQNTIAVLGHPDPKAYFSDPEVWARGDVLSGEKVDPFFANVAGELRRMTVDTHQLRYGPSGATSLARRAAYEAGFTGAADELSQALEMPEALQVAHGQEMSWEPMRQLGEMAGRGRGSVEDLLFDEAGNLRMDTLEELDRRMQAAQDFGQYLGTEEGRALVAYGGGDPQFEQVQRTGLDPEQAAAARQRVLDNPEHVRAAARRADMGYAGDYLFQFAPWLAAGAGAGLLRQYGNAEQPPQPGRPRGLFDGVQLPPVGR